MTETSQPTIPRPMSRVPKSGRPRRPSFARVRGPGTPSTRRPLRFWKTRIARLVIGPAIPSIGPA